MPAHAVQWFTEVDGESLRLADVFRRLYDSGLSDRKILEDPDFQAVNEKLEHGVNNSSSASEFRRKQGLPSQKERKRAPEVRDTILNAHVEGLALADIVQKVSEEHDGVLVTASYVGLILRENGRGSGVRRLSFEPGEKSGEKELKEVLSGGRLIVRCLCCGTEEEVSKRTFRNGGSCPSCARGGARSTCAADHDRIVAWRAKGKSYEWIGGQLGISYQPVFEYCKNHNIQKGSKPPSYHWDAIRKKAVKKALGDPCGCGCGTILTKGNIEIHHIIQVLRDTEEERPDWLVNRQGNLLAVTKECHPRLDQISRINDGTLLDALFDHIREYFLNC